VPTPAERRKVGRYVIESTLGAGGMGVVYKAVDPELDRVVAIKVLRSGLDVIRLKREAQGLAKLDHRNVVAVYDVGTQDEMFIAMEYVDGDTLREWLRKETREVDDIVAVLVDVARGVAAAHAAGLVHRDLKPDNVFVARNGRVLVGDFGLVESSLDAKGLPDADTDAARAVDVTTSRHVGTPAYMAPEQFSGLATAASDQFSFCVTAWEAFVGRRPFEGETIGEIFAKARTGTVVEPPSWRVPRKVQAALRRGLSADPARRFASMEDLLRELAPRNRRRILMPVVVLVAAGSLAAAAAIAVGRHGGTDVKLIACGDEAAAMATVWNPARRGEVEHAIEAVASTGDDVAARAIQVLDDTASRWIATRRQACNQQHQSGRALFEQRLACLHRVEADVGVAADVLIEKKSITVEDTMFLETAFPVTRCLTRAGISTDLATLSPELDRIRAALVRDQLAGSTSAGLGPLQQLSAQADASGDARVAAEVAAVVARYAYQVNLYPTAEAAARHAIDVAERAGADLSRATAAATLAESLARETKFSAAAEQLAAADAAWQRTERDPQVALAIAAAQAEVALLRNDPQHLQLQKQVVEQTRRLYGPKSLNLASELVALAESYPSADRGSALPPLEEAMAILHADSAFTADLAWTNANVEKAKGDLPRMIDAQRDFAAFAELHLGREIDASGVASAYQDLGIYLELATRWREAMAAYRHALELLTTAPDSEPQARFDALLGLGSVQLEDGSAADAVHTLDQARALVTDSFPSFTDRSALDAALGRAHEAVGDHAAAIHLLEPLLEPLRTADPPRHKAFGLLCASLSRALWSNGGARARARELAGDAITALDTTLAEFASDPTRGPQSVLVKRYRDETQAWLASHAP